MIYGLNPIMEALKVRREDFERILISEGRNKKDLRPILELVGDKRVEWVKREYLDRLSKGGRHQGILGIIADYPYAEVEDILKRWKQSSQSALILILDSISDPQNLGSLIRTAEASGVHGIILPKDRACPITASATKASAGALEHMLISRVVNLSQIIDYLKKEGIWIIGTDQKAQDNIYSLDANLSLAIIIGSEGRGIRPLLRKRCDFWLSITLKGKVSSLNAAISGAIILFEVLRQRAFNQSL